MVTINFMNWRETSAAAEKMRKERDSRTNTTGKRNGKRGNKRNLPASDGLPTDAKMPAQLSKTTKGDAKR